MSGGVGSGGGGNNYSDNYDDYRVGIQNSQGGAGESQDYCWQMIKVSSFNVLLSRRSMGSHRAQGTATHRPSLGSISSYLGVERAKERRE